MHENRNLFVVLLLIITIVWAFFAWFVFSADGTFVWIQRFASIGAGATLTGLTWYVLNIEDKIPDRLSRAVGTPMYYDVDGLSFMPTIRMREDGQAELSVFYQNRFENYVQAIVHLRPPPQSFVVRPGVRDMHFTFKADGGDFGVIHQPIGVPAPMGGEVIEVKVAAAVRYPRSHGDRLLKYEGLPCGSFPVDWLAAFKVGVHEVSGEIAIERPATLHLALPRRAHEVIRGSSSWRQEVIEPGPSAAAVLG